MARGSSTEWLVVVTAIHSGKAQMDDSALLAVVETAFVFRTFQIISQGCADERTTGPVLAGGSGGLRRRTPPGCYAGGFRNSILPHRALALGV